MDSTFIASTEKKLGNEAFKKGDFNSAVVHFSKAIESTPDDHILYSNRSAAYSSMGKYTEALTDADITVKLSPKWPRGHSRRASALHFLGRLNEALDEYKIVLQYDPANAQAKDAIKTIEASIAKQNEAKEPAKKEAKEPVKKEDKKAKEEDKPKAGASDKSRKEAQEQEKLRELAELGLKMSRSERKAAADKEKDLGNKDYKGKKFESAIQHYKRAIAINPGDVTYRSNMSAAYFEMGQMDKCIEVCLGCIDDAQKAGLFKLVPKLLTRLGTAYDKIGNLEKSAEFYRKSFNALKCAETLNKLGRIEELIARRELNKRIEPESKADVDWAQEEKRGNELFRDGNYVEAAKSYELAIRASPTKKRALHFNKSAALIKLGDFENALSEAEKSLEIDPNFCNFCLHFYPFLR